MRIALEPANQPEVVALIDALDAYQIPLYPPESHHGIDLAALSQPHVLFAVALDRRGEPHAVRAFSLHPGAIMTELVRHLSAAELGAMSPASAPMVLKTPEQGAATQVWCATSPQLAGMGGVYCEDVDVAVEVAADSQGLTGVRPWAIDPALAERLWELSEIWTGARFAG